MKVRVKWSSALLLFLWSSVNGQSCPTSNTTSEIYTPTSTASQLNINSGFLSPFVESFLGTVQPNHFPKDLLVTIVQNPNVFTQKETIKEILTYEMGFLVCATIGIIYTVLVPVIGLFFACCRCCGNCGGRMYQKQTPYVHCRRVGLYWSTLTFTLLILVGNVCMFFSATYSSETVNRSPGEITIIVDNLQNYLNSIPKQLQQVANESAGTVGVVKYNLNETGPLLGQSIQNSLSVPLTPAFNLILETAQVLNSSSNGLLQVNVTVNHMRQDVFQLQGNLSAVRQKINQTLLNPACRNCLTHLVETDKLSLEANLEILNLNGLISSVNTAKNTDVTGQATKSRRFLDKIPEQVQNETADIVKKTLVDLTSLEDKLSALTGAFPLGELSAVTEILSSVQTDMSSYSPLIQMSSKTSLAVGLGLSGLVLLVVVCNVLGLLMGSVGLNPKDIPSERSGTSNCGGVFLMAGVGFSFLFSWIFMIVVLMLFLLGGHMQTFICQPLQNKELFQLLDTPGLIQGFNLSRSLNLTTDLKIYDIYRDCQDDDALWSTLHLNEIFDLNQILNISQYTDQIYKGFQGTQISIANISILSPDIKSELNILSANVSSVNLSSTQINVGTNLSSAAETLDVLSTNQTNQTIKNELNAEAKGLRDIQTELTSLMIELNATISNVSMIVSQINATVQSLLTKVGYAQDVLNHNLSQIVKTESSVYIDCQMELFKALVLWANQTITQKLGQCKPAADVVDQLEQLVCGHVVASVNAFWFSLGWCVIFLIPSIISSVKLAKHYRKMKHADVHDTSIMLNPFPKATLQAP